MLKFIRKYQIIMLAIGGSLLMVVFLIGPVLQQVLPSLTNTTIATLDGGAGSMSIHDRQRASQEIGIMSRVIPFMFGKSQQGGGGLINLDDEMDHWLLLTYEAGKAGLIGGADDGRLWIDQELASIYAVTEKRLQLYQEIPYMPFVNQQMQSPQVQAEIAAKANDLRVALPSRVRSVASGMGTSEDTVYEMLAKARGVLRMVGRHDRAIRQSDRDIVEAVREVFDAAITDFIMVPASVLVDEESTPTDEQLSAQFERFKDKLPGEDELGFGYILPPRVQMGWLTLDHGTIASTVDPDRISIHKRWAENRDRFAGEFEAERDRVRKELVDEQVADMMVDADRIIVGRLRAALQGVPKNGPYYEIPHNWGGVTMESLSEAIVEEMKAQRNIDFPVPGITYRVEKWFTETDLAKLEGFGRAYWQVGPDRVPVSAAPTLARELGGSPRLALQKRIPVVDPVARDDAGSRYYVVLFNTREQSPPDSWEEIREQLTTDVRLYETYESLKTQLPELEQMAMTEGGITEIAQRFNPPPQSESEEIIPADAERLTPSKWAIVTRNGLRRVDPAKSVDSRANVQVFRDAVMAKAETLDPMVPYGTLPRADTVITVDMPAQRAVAVANILAFRPATTDQRYSLLPRDIAALATREYTENQTDELYPFSLEALKARHKFTERTSRKGEDEEG